MRRLLLAVFGVMFLGCPATPTPNDPKPQPINNCELSSDYTFYSDGLRLYQERVKITAKGEFSITRTFNSSGKSASCKAQMSCEGGNILGVPDVKSAVENAEIDKAFSSGVDFYGQDGRPRDIPAFVIEGPKGKLQVGQACQTTLGGCVAIPPAVSAMVDMMRDVQSQYSNQGDCGSLPNSL